MAADISALGELRPVEPLNLSGYADNKRGTFVLPPRGEYLLQAPESFVFARTQKGSLSADVSSKIVEGPFEGFKLRFQKVSASQWKDKDGATKSQVGDYLRAFGFTDRLTDEQVIADAIERTANLTYTAYLDWEANHFATKFAVKGMKNFPKNDDGTHQSWVEHPTEKDEDGNPLRIRAGLVVRTYVPAE